MATPIGPLSKSIYADVPADGYRTVFDEFAGKLAAETNWFARRRLLLDLLRALEVVIVLETRQAEEAGEETAGDPRSTFITVVPFYLGGILEKLGETEIASLEQAAFYLLSAHPEHQAAAERWLEADPRRLKAFRKFVKANRYYRDLMGDFADALEG